MLYKILDILKKGGKYENRDISKRDKNKRADILYENYQE